MLQALASRRRSTLNRHVPRLIGFVVMAAWVLMPLMPLLALAFTWLDDLT